MSSVEALQLRQLDGNGPWLGDCEGFTVEGSGGRLGVVADVQCDAGGAVEALIVLGGMLGNRLFVVPADDVAVVQPRRQRVGLVERPVGVGLLGRDDSSSGATLAHAGSPAIGLGEER